MAVPVSGTPGGAADYVMPIVEMTQIGTIGLGRHAPDRRPHGRGVVTSFLLELVVYPAIYAGWRGRHLG